MPTCIYVVKDPCTLSVVYVGQTTNFKTRVAAHINSKHVAPIGQYMLYLKSIGVKPIFEVYKKCYLKTRFTHEYAVTYYFAKQGCLLLNSNNTHSVEANRNLQTLINLKRNDTNPT